MNEVGDDENVSVSDNANLIRELKKELENQNQAKQKAINILTKLKTEGKLDEDDINN